MTLADAPAGSLDLIVVDAFSSDAIPIHLMTTEAISLYLAKLKPSGAVLFHISNRNMDLGPVVAATAHAKGLATWIRPSRQTPELLAQMKYSPHVAVVARRPEDVALPAGQGWGRQDGPRQRARLARRLCRRDRRDLAQARELISAQARDAASRSISSAASTESRLISSRDCGPKGISRCAVPLGPAQAK